MADKAESPYKTCRKLAGLTQNQASERLHVEVRRLSDYENGAKVPDDVVDRMAEVYNAPLLAIWHIKMGSPLGKYLPDFFPTQTNNDLGFQTVLAKMDAIKAEEHIVSALEDNELTAHDLPHLDCYLAANDAATGKLISTKAYVVKVRNEILKTLGAQ